MEASSISSMTGGCLEVPRFEFQLHSASFGCFIDRRTRRGNRGREIVDPIVRFRKPWFLRASRCLMGMRSGVCCRDSGFHLGIGYCSWRPETKSALFAGRGSYVRICSELGWALDEKAIEDGVHEGNPEKSDTFLEETQGKIVDNVQNDAALRLNENNIIDDDVRIETRGKKDFVEKKPGRVDVRALAQRLHVAECLEDIEKVLKDKGELPPKVFSAIIKEFGKRLESAIALVHWLKKRHEENNEYEGPNLFIYNSLLGAVKRSGQLDTAFLIMNEMLEVGISPDVVTYNTLMGVYLSQGRADEALSLFDDFQSKGISPSAVSYSTALQAYRRKEDGIGALKLFTSVREKYVNGELSGEEWETELPEIRSFTSRICYQVMRQLLVKDGNYSTNVLKLLIEMDKANLPPIREECEQLVWACTREEHYPVAKELYNRIRERHSVISLSVCNHIIWLMGKAKKWWAALEIYEDLLDKGPQPNSLSDELIVSHFNVLLSAARKKGIWRWGVKLLNKMEEKGLKPGSREWDAVLVACSKASEVDTAVKIFKRMIDRGEKPNIVSYGALLSALEKRKLYDEAIRVWEHMLKVGVEPNIYVYTIMASVYVGLGKFHLVDSIVKEMVSTGNIPTVVTFNAIITVCARNCLGGNAYEWFQRMRDMNIEPNEVTYEMLIEALAKDGKPRIAYDVYLRAINEGLSPSAQAYDAVIQSSQDLGATVDASALGPRPPEKEHRQCKELTNIKRSL